MMEKYGVERKDLPVSGEQLDKIAELCNERGKLFIVPKNAEEADKILEGLLNENQ